MKIADIRNLSDAELASKRQESRQEMFNLRQQKVTSQLEKPSRIKDLRKTVARIETILSDRKNKAAKSA
ncbi:MAG: 50S ribosomal protein L29 [Verrucomicrobiota bacterium]|jgi:large subunit ribosomal protein L29